MRLNKFYSRATIAFLFWLLLPALSFAKGEASGWEELFDDSFKSIFSDSLLLHKELLSGCESGHRRGRFLWLRAEDLPELNDSQSTLEISRVPVNVRYGEFFYQENSGSPYLVFHALSFSEYTRSLRYFEICPKNNASKETFCKSSEIKFAIYDRDPKVVCMKAPAIIEAPSDKEEDKNDGK